ncbi:hypothetical protein [Acidimangrovimonas pyrenivorans]|uniref:Uncharacterized protein n=1 Tax=Acidimangrovimonas pyrenivorans TaxID=2030798 RepID=A0ABV7AJP8_9RHOB
MPVSSSDPRPRPRPPRRFRRALLAAVALPALALPALALPTLALTVFAGPAAALDAARDAQLKAQWQQYEAVQPKSILALQPWRRTTETTLADGRTPLRFIDLNPDSNGWFLLQIGKDGSRAQQSYHLENPDPRRQSVALSTDPTPALVLGGAEGETRCTPWTGALEKARDSRLPYAPLCGGRLLLRNHASGSRSSLESVTDFLRDNVWGGEQVVGFVRSTFYKDAFAEFDKAEGEASDNGQTAGPAPARMDHLEVGTLLDIGLTGTTNGRMALGEWYPAAGLKGIYATAFQPGAVDRAVLKSPGRVNGLDGVEARATGYMVAFDLSRYALGFELGTDHPRLNWSPRPPAAVRPRGLPGPDGVASSTPLETLGMVSPAIAPRTVATFTAGFKRSHGAFKWGPYAGVNHGTHYGFLEHGVIFSKLQPGLSTLYVLDDGTIGMKTWTEADDVLLPKIRFARQNGVPLIERDPKTGKGVPGTLVTQWGAGNWSGSADAKLRTLRAGACLLDHGGTAYLAYAYFSTATPSAMTRTFQAYGCRYAMLLDMNALEHTYLALYLRHAGKVQVEHLVPGMALIDKKTRGGGVIPRFLGYPDNRDLFYLYSKEGTP